MGKHSGGSGKTMKSAGDWKGNRSNDETEELPKQDQAKQQVRDQVRKGTEKGGG